MFIKITTPTNPLRIENILHPYKRGEQPFTPKVAKQILSSTNYPRSIRDMLTLIANLPTSEQAQYKNLVIATFDHREQPNDVTIIGKKLALANNYEDELNQIINHDPTTDNKDGIIYAPAINEVAAYICYKIKPDLSEYPSNATVYFANDRVFLSSANLAAIKTFKFKNAAHISLFGCRNLPANLDVSMCRKIDLADTDLSKIKNLKFPKDSNVDLSYCRNLPEDLDVSMCNEVCLCQTDLSSVKTFTFKNKTQKKNSSAEFPQNWQGKIIYSENIFTHLNTLFKKPNTR